MLSFERFIPFVKILKKKIAFSHEVFLAMVILLVASIFALTSVQKMADDFSAVSNSSSYSVVVNELSSQVKESQNNHNLYMTTADKQYLDNYEFLTDIATSTISVLLQRTEESDQKGRLIELKSKMKLMYEEMVKMHSILRASGYVVGLDIRENQTLRLLKLDVSSLLEQTAEASNLYLERSGLSARRHVDFALNAIYIMIAAVFAFAVGVFYYIKRESAGRNIVAEESGAILRSLKMKIMDLENENHRLEDVVESAHIAVLSLSEGGNILYANRYAEKLTGYPVTALLGEHISALLELQSQGRYANYFKQFTQMEEEEQKLKSMRETLAQREDGSTFPMEIDITSTRLGRYRYVAVVRDITLRKDMETELQKLRQSKDERDSLKTKNVLKNIGDPKDKTMN